MKVFKKLKKCKIHGYKKNKLIQLIGHYRTYDKIAALKSCYMMKYKEGMIFDGVLITPQNKRGFVTLLHVKNLCRANQPEKTIKEEYDFVENLIQEYDTNFADVLAAIIIVEKNKKVGNNLENAVSLVRSNRLKGTGDSTIFLRLNQFAEAA